MAGLTRGKEAIVAERGTVESGLRAADRGCQEAATELGEPLLKHCDGRGLQRSDSTAEGEDHLQPDGRQYQLDRGAVPLPLP